MKRSLRHKKLMFIHNIKALEKGTCLFFKAFLLSVKMDLKKELTSRIQVALDKIRPFLKKDEGDISLIEVTDDLDVRVEMTGSCKTCQHIDQTFNSGVVQFIRREAPEVRNIIAL